MSYFFDNNFAPALVNILRELEVDAIHLRELFPPNTPDEQWLPAVGAAAHILITCDLNINRKSAEREALRGHRVTALFFQKAFMKRTTWEKALWLLRHWPKLHEQAQRLRPGSVMKVTDQGKLEAWE